MCQSKCGASAVPTRLCTVAMTQQGTPKGNTPQPAEAMPRSGEKSIPGGDGGLKPEPPGPGSASVPVPGSAAGSGALAGLATTVTRVAPSGCAEGSYSEPGSASVPLPRCTRVSGRGQT